MRIANPIYDSVFKHLMENQEIAIGLVSRLLGVEVISLVPQAQELTQQHANVIGSNAQTVRVFRVDFAAEVRLADGSVQKVLVELQKALGSDVIGRFRAYLGGNYAKDAKTGPLPIIAIYMLGFALNKALPKVIKVKRQYLDGVTGATLPEAKEEFIEMLTHDAVIVQISELNDSVETDIERALAVFDQRNKDKGNPHFLVIGEEVSKDPFVEKMIRSLLAAASDEETNRKMDMEDELENVFEQKATAEAATAEALRKMEEANLRTNEANLRTNEANLRTNEANLLTNEANVRTEAANVRTEAERRQKEEANKRVAELEAKLRELEGR